MKERLWFFEDPWILNLLSIEMNISESKMFISIDNRFKINKKTAINSRSVSECLEIQQEQWIKNTSKCEGTLALPSNSDQNDSLPWTTE